MVSVEGCRHWVEAALVLQGLMDLRERAGECVKWNINGGFIWREKHQVAHARDRLILGEMPSSEKWINLPERRRKIGIPQGKDAVIPVTWSGQAGHLSQLDNPTWIVLDHSLGEHASFDSGGRIEIRDWSRVVGAPHSKFETGSNRLFNKT
jgi:hypothetical protein